MHIWMRAVCDEHKEACRITVVNSSSVRHDLLHYTERLIVAFLHLHYGCKLRLIHNDLDLDYLHANGYTMVDSLKSSEGEAYWQLYTRK